MFAFLLWLHFPLLAGKVALENFKGNYTDKRVDKLKKINKLSVFLFA